ncbi:hypothetical protein DICPUDRAFT_52772 [Dictyostelium purpureum]|uniref:Hydroxysteroid dehydrogenase-like protein 2 n=1 Tax=Dictyostelium purpureum TaxID=5786 RepID=F0Z9Y1_DICPU|nr:uncharacterized protein DICPUDRAFT_52772 [Dictyostelium purpureum]EGC39196.1 hypothetical protein DICPUDRAFT_52772 [Dictyostelium purpureum]|eukprot:XP_003284223.1 hypothetical protein DICPUDRAFT_52772 [Dictyostelium purpureum]
MLKGKTLFITGASRGIGEAIAKAAAKEGANIVIAAKTADPHPKLKGTIYSVQKDIEALGGRCLACSVDIRYEDQIEKAVEEAVKTFGGIDILVNNASAISLTGTLETPAKKFDLMMGVNARGTYLTTQKCLPYLLKSKDGGRVLNISPPLNMDKKWFSNHPAYTMAKYGMSMCVLGMAEEFKGKVAFNALWPKTSIYTAAMEMLGGSDVAKECRTVDIMSDSALWVFKQPISNTGNFFIDEYCVKQAGVTDLEKYSIVKGAKLMNDFFLDDDVDYSIAKNQIHRTTPLSKL